MTERTRDGFRLAPGGEELQILIEYAEGLPVPAMELIKEYWEAVGVKVLLKVETGQSRNVTRTLNEHDVRASGRSLPRIVITNLTMSPRRSSPASAIAPATM